MSVTYSTNLALNIIGDGTEAGTWGGLTNTNIGTLLEQAISGYYTNALTGTSSSLTMTSGASAIPRNMYLELTGTLSATHTLTIPTNSKLYFIYNNTKQTLALSSLVRASNVVTATTSSSITSLIQPGDSITIASVTTSAFNGTFTVSTVPSSTTFTYAQSGANDTATIGSGTTTAFGFNVTLTTGIGTTTTVPPRLKSLLVVDNSGNVNTAVNAGATLSNDTGTATNLYPLFADATTGSANTIYTSNSNYLYKPSTGALTLTGAVTGANVVASNGFFVNSNAVNADYTVATNYNAHSVGPITISSGITVTVASGAVWLVL